MITIGLGTAMKTLYVLYENRIRLERFNESETFRGKYDEEIFDFEKAITEIATQYDKMLVKGSNYPTSDQIEQEVTDNLDTKPG